MHGGRLVYTLNLSLLGFILPSRILHGQNISTFTANLIFFVYYQCISFVQLDHFTGLVIYTATVFLWHSVWQN
jgi:hypothetical protein